MRLCILNDNFYRASGITKALERLALSESFGKLDLFLAGCNSVRNREVSPEEQHIVPRDRHRTFFLMRKGALFAELLGFIKWLREIKCELIHVHHRRLSVLANLITPLTGIPVLFTGHLTFPEAIWFRYCAPRHMTGVSPSVVDYLQRCTRATNVSLIYNPHIFPERAPKVIIENPPRVVAMGRLEAIKGHALLIQAWSRLKEQGLNAQLDIIGEGQLRSHLEEFIFAKGVTDRVRLLGFVDNVDQRLNSYAFHVLTSEKEGFPNAVIESATHALPSLVTNVPGSRDTLPPDLVLPNCLPYGDVAALTQALATWIQSPDKIAADGLRFFEHLRMLCDPDAAGRKYLDLYNEMLSATGTSLGAEQRCGCSHVR